MVPDSPFAFHGGALWSHADPTFREERPPSVAADVLDAWFGPPPALWAEYLSEAPFLFRTSPPTHAEGLERTIAGHRGVPPECVVAGAGSSTLIHLILRQLLSPQDILLLLEPTYSEYRHVGQTMLRAVCHEFILPRDSNFQLDECQYLQMLCSAKPRVAVLVRPNNPTGTLISAAEVIAGLPHETTLILDEAYLDYTDLESAEKLAASRSNVVVIKSLSKAFGLSGLRAAYAVASVDLAVTLRNQMPPWAVSGPAQWWGCRIWDHLGYYRERHQETRRMRQELVTAINKLPGHILSNEANWVLWEHDLPLPTPGLLEALRRDGIFIRDASQTSSTLNPRTLRMSVRPPEEQHLLIEALQSATGM